MSKKISIPTPLRAFVNQQDTVPTMAATVGDALMDLTHHFPALTPHIYDNQQQLRKFINIYVNDTDIRDANGLDTPLADNDELALVPAIAGGCVE
jgi:molybdopterin converting factor small subunit